MTIMAKDNATPNKPVAIFRSHGISAKVFENYAKDDKKRERPFYKVRTERTYMVDGEFRSIPVFDRDQVMVANMLNEKAWKAILKLEEEARKSRFDEAENDE